jgi:spore coat protein H
MKKKLLLALLLIFLLGSVFLVNYWFIAGQEEQTAGIPDDRLAVTVPAADQAAEQAPDATDGPTVSVQDPVRYATLFDNGKIHHFKIVISQEEWEGLSRDMLDIRDIDGNMRTGNYRKADLYYSDENGEIFVDEVGIRTKGNMSRILPEDADGLHRFHFKIKFDETFDIQEGSADYDIRNDRSFAEVSELNFKINNGSDPTNIREIFSYDLFNAFGVTAPRASMATLTFVIDGTEHDYGVVRYIESVDKSFLGERFGSKMNDGNLYKCLWQNYGPASLMPLRREAEIGIKDWTENYRPTYDLKTNKEERNYQDLESFIDNLNKLEGNELKAYLDKNFSIDRFIRAQALDVLLGQIDGYWSMGNNYYLYFNENGVLEWIPFDYEHVLAAGWDGDPYWSYEGIATADIYQWNNLNAQMYDKNTTHPLMDKILQIDEYKNKYEEYLRTLIEPANNYFTYNRFMELYNRLYNLYGDNVDNEMQEGSLWELSNEEWYFNTKTDSVRQQLARNAR